MDEVSKKPSCIEVTCEQKFTIGDAKPAPVTIYDYYMPSESWVLYMYSTRLPLHVPSACVVHPLLKCKVYKHGGYSHLLTYICVLYTTPTTCTMWVCCVSSAQMHGNHSSFFSIRRLRALYIEVFFCVLVLSMLGSVVDQ